MTGLAPARAEKNIMNSVSRRFLSRRANLVTVSIFARALVIRF